MCQFADMSQNFIANARLFKMCQFVDMSQNFIENVRLFVSFLTGIATH